MPPSKNISFEELSKYFHLPINQVAKELGVCATILKKICRRNGIPRWPHRKIKSLDKMIGNLEMNIAKNPAEKEELNKEIEALKTKRVEILKNPDILLVKNRGDDPLRPGHIKMKRSGGQRIRDEDDDEPTCFVPANDGRYIMAQAGPGFATLQNLGAYPPQQHTPSYVDMIFNAQANPFGPTAYAVPVQQPQNITKPQIINTLANMKFDINSPSSIRKNPSIDLSSYSYDLNAHQNPFLHIHQQQPQPTQTFPSPQKPSISPTTLPAFNLGGQEPYALPSIRMIDPSNIGRVPPLFSTFREDISGTPSVPFLNDTPPREPSPVPTQPQQPNLFNLNATNSSSNLPSWFDEEKSRYLGKST